MLALAFGALATLRASLQVSYYGYHDCNHYDHDRYYNEGQSDEEQLPHRPPVDRTCIFEQMPVSELAVMVQGCR